MHAIFTVFLSSIQERNELEKALALLGERNPREARSTYATLLKLRLL